MAEQEEAFWNWLVNTEMITLTHRVYTDNNRHTTAYKTIRKHGHHCQKTTNEPFLLQPVGVVNSSGPERKN